MSTDNSNNNNNYPSHLKIASIISILHITIGLIFWRWSISLWVRGRYDSGIVLFLFPIVTGLLGVRIVYLLRHKQNNDISDDQEVESSVDQFVQTNDRKKCCIRKRKPPLKCWFVLLLLTHILTTAVYAAAAVIGMQRLDITRGYQIYCIIAAICWAVSGVIVAVWSCRHRDKFQQNEN